eukprot:TRINITY_DN15224_c0_g1_i1.p1 TRINITY_DN15224_c0_g1~~TRINITY_DN15224_c0_g1_i1.p1  ORF type:complete len:134 (+),score=21.44 TRINITY_DN15224_c0_g1_i1:89-490(+)
MEDAARAQPPAEASDSYLSRFLFVRDEIPPLTALGDFEQNGKRAYDDGDLQSYIFDGKAGKKQRKKITSRAKFTPEMLEELSVLYANDKYVTPASKQILAKKFGFDPAVITNWFQNRRNAENATIKRKNADSE